MSDSEKNEADAVGMIAPIQSQDVRRIVAGQVISDLASTVKELVDNSLDSGAKSINIRLFNQGVDVIEVSDDGCGVPEESRPMLAMKHATSKIRTFDELYANTYEDGQMQLKQLGFRGEALFALANISQNLVISTRTENDSIGEKMEFRSDGCLDSKSRAEIPRKVGTTVAIVKLFDALPVRRADFIKRIKSQRAKMLRLLQAYAVLCVGVRFNLIDITGRVGSPKCKTEVKLSTSLNSKSIKETVSQVFGSKFLAGLCPVRIDLGSLIIPPNESEIESVNKNMWRVEGLISKAPGTESKGKSAREIQFYSINGRPVDLPKISRIIAEAWRQFETVGGDSSKKRPACILGIYLPNCMFDVNVAPDKREVFLSEEIALYDTIKTSLVQLWMGQSDGKFVANEAQDELSGKKRPIQAIESKTQFSQQSPLPVDPLLESTQGPIPSSDRHTKRNAFTRASIGEATTDFVYPHIASLRRGEELHIRDADNETSLEAATPENEETNIISSPGRDSLSISDQKKWNQTRLQFSPSESGSLKESIGILRSSKYIGSTPDQESKREDGIRSKSKVHSSRSLGSSVSVDESPLLTSHQRVSPVEDMSDLGNVNNMTPIESPCNQKSISINDAANANESEPCNSNIERTYSNASSESDTSNKDKSVSKETKTPTPNGTTIVIENVVWSEFTQSSVLGQARAARERSVDRRSRLADAKKIRNCISKQGEYQEDDGTLSLSKDDFVTMNVIGQFNLGFILAVGQDGQLWILDQHACDEKYNFEKLCKETKIHEQNLIAPLPLELSPSEENCVLEHLGIFEKNGFRFNHDRKKPPRHRLSLTAVPHSGSGGDGRKAVQFGPRDVGALCALLGADGACSSNGYIAGSGSGADGAGKSGNNAVRRHAGMGTDTIRLPKAVAMFASRACRSSIMIGESLSQGKMNEVITKLQKLEHPWTCAHGRPTVRHVKDLLEQMCEDENGI